MYVKLSDLFTQQQRQAQIKDKIQYHPAGSSLYEDSLDKASQRNTLREPTTTKHVIDGFKQQVKQSMNIINTPKSNLFGHAPVIQWSSQNFFKQTSKNFNQTKMNTESSRGFHNQMMQTGFSNPPPSSQRQRILIDADPLKSAQQIMQNRKIDTADWANLKEGIDVQLNRKAHTTVKTQQSQSSISLIKHISSNKNITMKERMKTVHDQFYKMRLVFSDSFSSSNNNDFKKEETSRYQNGGNTLRTKFGSSSTKFFNKEDLYTSGKKNGKFQTMPTEQTDRENIPTSGDQKFHHQMQSSICMAQIKPIKGGRVKKQEKEKFQHYYDSVSERLHDIKQTRTLNKFEFSRLSDFNWQQIKYQPVNEKEDMSLKEIRDLYLRERIIGAQNQVEAILSNREKEEKKKQQKINQQKEDQYMDEYRKKTFFLYKNVEEEAEDEKMKKQQKQMNKVDYTVDYKKLFAGLSSHDLYAQGDREKFKRVRKQLREYLQKHFTLGISLYEAMENSIFKREPFVRPNSEDFFIAVKTNDTEKVRELLFRDKYLVYQFDCTLQTPLHWAAKRGYMEVAEMLINKNCDIDSKDQLGRTPLYFAYREGHNNMGKLLLLQKASPWSNKRNNLDEAVYSRDTNDKTTIKIAKQIHLMMMMAKFKQKQKIWDDTKYLFEDKLFAKEATKL